MLRRSQPRRRAGLQSPPLEAERLERLRELARRRLAGASRRTLLGADVNQAVEKRAGRHDERLAARACRPPRTPDRRSVRARRGCGRPAEDPRRCSVRVERASHPCAVDPLVRLGARRPDRRAAAAIQQLELNAGRVDRAAHQAAERVDLAHQVALRRAADRRIAGHVRDRVRATACRSRRGSQGAPRPTPPRSPHDRRR